MSGTNGCPFATVGEPLDDTGHAMTPDDFRILEKSAPSIRSPVDLRLGVSDDERVSLLEAFLDELTRRIEGVSYRKEATPAGSPPVIKLPRGIYFMAVPTGGKLAPFLEILAMISEEKPTDGATDSHEKLLRGLSAPCPVRLHIAGQCPHCPASVSLWSRLAAHSPLLRLTVVDVDLFTEIAQSDRVRAVPTLVFDENLRWTGSIRPQDVLPVLADQDPVHLDVSALQGFIKEGDAALLARMMSRRGKLFPAIVDLLTHPKWPERLGAMVVMETLAEENPGLAVDVVEPLVASFGKLDSQAKGDVIYILGETGTESVVPFIQSAAQGSVGEELKSAAVESIARIHERHGHGKETAR